MYDNVKLDKSLYSITGKTFTQALAEQDPDSAYEGTELSALDAFERQLKRFDIRVSGPGCDMVEKFFVSSESAVLFPEYVRRMIKKGMDDNAIAPKVCAAVSYTDSMDFRGLTLTDDNVTNPVAQAGTLPGTSVRLAGTAQALQKFARKINCSYESIRKQRLEAFGVILREMGASVARALNTYTVTTLMTGITATDTASTSITYADLANFWSSMADHNMNVMILNPADLAAILALDEMKLVIGDYMAGGSIATPYGVTLVKCSGLTAGKVIGLDADCAAELVMGTDIVVDFDKLISSQCDEIACSITVGVSRLAAGAVKVLNKKSS